jgi:hypothetical protein
MLLNGGFGLRRESVASALGFLIHEARAIRGGGRF